MCGLVAIVDPEIKRSEIEAANACIQHRGPDDAHVWMGPHVALAARRLSIIDLAGGRQPLCNEDASVWITYNGEVFNAPELRAELEALGHIFATHSDTEAIVHGYEEWGDDIIARLRGMFAFAIWDVKRERLLVARDRFGIKPLYYAQLGKRFVCASEIRPILTALPNLTRRANATALDYLFEVGHIPTPLTAFEGIQQLPAAHQLVVTARGVSVSRYWQLSFPQASARTQHLNEDEALDGFMHHLRDAVASWRLADVPVGSLLSGGVDSSALAALLTEVGGPIHTFNIGFDAASHDESAIARKTAAHMGSTHHEIRFGSAEFDLLPHVVNHLEAPQCSATSIPIYLLYKACRDAGLKVIMTGEGADELLGGYHWFDGDRRAQRYLNWPRPIRQLAARLPLPMSAGARRVLAQAGHDPILRYALWQQISTRSERAALLGRQPHTLISAKWHTDHIEQMTGRANLDQFLLLDTQTRMVDFINFEVDRMSMAASVEARAPFLDHKLWEYVIGLPPEFKLSDVGNKLLLRRGMQPLLPRAVRQRPKQGLASPHAMWWRQAKLPAWADVALGSGALSETGYFSAETVHSLRQAHQSGKANNSRLLTGVLTTQLWHDAFKVQTA